MQYGIIKLYGEIWDWNDNSASRFISRLTALDSQHLDVINLHVHCKGGDVLEGVAIYNAIKACKTPVNLYVDGIAASMMTIIMLACRNIYMADNAFLMIHAPSGFAYGTAKILMKTVNALLEMEKNFIREYSAKTGKPESEVSEWLDGGDNWFSARQAMDAKIIDGIVGAVDTDAIPPQDEELQNTTAEMLFRRFAALGENDNSNNTQSQKLQSKMDKEKVIKQFGLTYVTVESSEEAIYQAIADKMQASENAKATAETALKAQQTAQITSFLASVKEAKGLTDDDVKTFTQIGEAAGFEAMQKALNAVNPAPSIFNALNGGKGGNDDKSKSEPKTFTELQALGDAAMTAYKKDRPQDYARLYEAEFGHKF